MGHRKGRGTAKWDVKERGLPGGALHRKREHSQGRTAYDVKLPTVKGETLHECQHRRSSCYRKLMKHFDAVGPSVSH